MDVCARNLMFDLASNREIYDEEQGRVMTKAEANDAIRKVCFEELGLTEKSTDKEIKRALKSDRANGFFSVIEEIVDTNIAYGISDNEFFNQYVETKNLADGDRNEFWVDDDDVLLTVSQVSGDHHDLSMQRLASGERFAVTTANYGIKVGGDIRLFLTGRKDWSQFVDAITRAYMNLIQNMVYGSFVSGTNKLAVPSVLTGTGTLVKDDLDAIIEKVAASNQSEVVIMGTKSALRKLTALTKIDFTDPAASIKEAVAANGIIGAYEGTTLLELPQKFLDKTLTNILIPNNKLWIMPTVGDKFVKFVDYGETELEVSDKGDTVDDMQSYEVQRRMGVSVLMTRYFGVWTI